MPHDDVCRKPEEHSTNSPAAWVISYAYQMRAPTALSDTHTGRRSPWLTSSAPSLGLNPSSLSLSCSSGIFMQLADDTGSHLAPSLCQFSEMHSTCRCETWARAFAISVTSMVCAWCPLPLPSTHPSEGDIVYMNVIGQPIVILGTYQTVHELLEVRSPISSDRTQAPMADL